MSANKPDISQIQKYLNGELDAKAMYQLERQAQSDPFLMDALDGYSNIADNQNVNIDILNKKLNKRVAKGYTVNPILLWVASIAALLIAVLIADLLWFSPGSTEKQPIVNKTTVHQNSEMVVKTDTLKLQVNPSAKALSQISTSHTNVTNYHASQPNNLAAAELPRKQKVSNAITYRPNTQTFVAKSNTLANDLLTTTSPVNRAAIRLKSSQKLKEVTTTNGKMQVTGTVTDTTGHVLAGVKVYIKGTDIATLTDDKGQFAINAPSNQQLLGIDYVGYDHKQIALNSPDSLHIILNESAVNLAEVSIPSHSNDKSTGLAKAIPLDGWKNYQEYIRNNAVMPNGETGKVKLKFTVGANGQITNIKVIKGRTDAMNLKAIDLIKNGPEWHGDIEAREIRIKIRFHKSRKA